MFCLILLLIYDENKLRELCDKHDVEYIGVESKIKNNKRERFIQFVCNKHRDFGLQESTVYNFKRYKHVCQYCNGGKLKDVFRDRVRIANPDIEVLSEYKKWFDKVKCRCKVCNNEWEARPSVILYGGGCPKCGRKKANLAEMANEEDIVRRIQDKNPNIKVIGKYTGYHNYIKCKCLIDDTEWDSPVCHILSGDSSCPSCNQSKGERKLLELLNSFGYTVERQYSYDDCRYKYPLKFDAYVNELNALFEYQGEQHYMPINFSGKGKEWAEQQLEIIQIRDRIKLNYCKENNIPIIEIPYWERDNMEYFLLSKINELKEKTNNAC